MCVMCIVPCSYTFELIFGKIYGIIFDTLKTILSMTKFIRLSSCCIISTVLFPLLRSLRNQTSILQIYM